MEDLMGENGLAHMAAVLPSLLEDGLISDLEYRCIISKPRLTDRQAAIYQFITSKYRQEPQNVMKMLEVLTSGTGLHKDDQNSRDGCVDKTTGVNQLPVTQKNPLLLNPVIQRVFEFLPVNEIKNCRTVCRQWNFTAEPLLRNTQTIIFNPDTLRPSTFLEVFKYSLPELPFTSFKFYRSDTGKVWLVSELQKFFDEWGKNIKELEFNKIVLEDYHHFDITPWIAVAPNVTKFKMDCTTQGWEAASTRLQVGLATLHSVEYLSLTHCEIFTRFPNDDIRIAPLEITLKNVKIRPEPGSVDSGPICLNHYIVFSQAIKIEIRDMGNHLVDMGAQVFNAQSVHIESTRIDNWGNARGKIDDFDVSRFNMALRNSLEIKKLYIRCCTIDLSCIPSSIEKITFSGCIGYHVSGHELCLPNLRMLCFHNVHPNIRHNLLYLFRNATNVRE